MILISILTKILLNKLALKINLKSNYLYTDDLILVSETAAGLQSCIDSLHTFCTDWPLKVNLDKTEAMILSKRRNTNIYNKFYYGPLEIENCKGYKYLGVIFHRSGKLTYAAANLAEPDKHILL